MKYVYTAIFTLEPGTESVYNVHFPDLSGCYTFGTDAQDALFMAEDLLGFHLYRSERDGQTIPPPTPPHLIDPEGGFTTLVAADTQSYHERGQLDSAS